MVWVKLDDQFPSHPKMVLAGGDAAWLHVCALCYCGQYLTDGFVPKEIVPRLSDRKKPEQLAARLVAVGAWYDLGDRYEIHDYLELNPSREQVLEERGRRSAAGKRGAQKRWGTDSTGHSNSHGTSHDDRIGPSIGTSDAPVPVPDEEPKGSSTKAQRDALFDALVDVFGPATTPQRQSHYGKTITTMLNLQFAPDEVRRRGKNLTGRGWDNPSPEALLKWWDTLDTAPKTSELEGPPVKTLEDGSTVRFMPGTGWVAVA